MRLRYSNCSEESLLRRGRIQRIALEQNLAADAMQQSVSPVCFHFGCERQRFINPRQGCFRGLSLRFDFGKEALKKRNEQPVTLLGVYRDALLQLRDTGFTFAEPSTCPPKVTNTLG